MHPVFAIGVRFRRSERVPRIRRARSPVVLGGKAADFDAATVKLPAELLGRLREAAERFSKTRLERCFAELDGMSESPVELARHLRGLVETGDLRAVSRFLEQVKPEAIN